MKRYISYFYLFLLFAFVLALTGCTNTSINRRVNSFFENIRESFVKTDDNEYEMILYFDDSTSYSPVYLSQFGELGQPKTFNLNQDGSGVAELLNGEEIIIKNSSDKAFLTADNRLIDREEKTYYFFSSEFTAPNGKIFDTGSLYGVYTVQEAANIAANFISAQTREALDGLGDSHECFYQLSKVYDRQTKNEYTDSQIDMMYNFYPITLHVEYNTAVRLVEFNDEELYLARETKVDSIYNIESFVDEFKITFSDDRLSAYVQIDGADEIFEFIVIGGEKIYEYQEKLKNIESIDAQKYDILLPEYTWTDDDVSRHDSDESHGISLLYGEIYTINRDTGEADLGDGTFYTVSKTKPDSDYDFSFRKYHVFVIDDGRHYVLYGKEIE